ncbi:MAG: nuclear transport factor 2 family protein [Verrucomicrobiota bacterium]
MNPDRTADHVELLRRAYALWHETRGGSVEHWLGLMSGDVTIRSVAGAQPTLQFANPRDGLAEARHYFTALAAEWEMVHFTTEDFIAQGDRVVVLSRCSFRNRRTGREVESPKADVFRFRDGKIIEVVEFFDTAGAAAACQPG